MEGKSAIIIGNDDDFYSDSQHYMSDSCSESSHSPNIVTENEVLKDTTGNHLNEYVTKDYHVMYINKMNDVLAMEERLEDTREKITLELQPKLESLKAENEALRHLRSKLLTELENLEQKLNDTSSNTVKLMQKTENDVHKFEEIKSKLIKIVENNYQIVQSVTEEFRKFDISQILTPCKVILCDIGKQGTFTKATGTGTKRKGESLATVKKVRFEENITDLEPEKTWTVKKRRKDEHSSTENVLEYDYDDYFDKTTFDDLIEMAKKSYAEYVRKCLDHVIGSRYLIHCTASGQLNGLKRPAIPLKIKKFINGLYNSHKMDSKKKVIMNNFNTVANAYITKLREDAGCLENEISREEEKIILQRFVDILP